MAKTHTRTAAAYASRTCGYWAHIFRTHAETAGCTLALNCCSAGFSACIAVAAMRPRCGSAAARPRIVLSMRIIAADPKRKE